MQNAEQALVENLEANMNTRNVRGARIKTGRKYFATKDLRSAARRLGCEIECVNRVQTRYEGVICEWIAYGQGRDE